MGLKINKKAILLLLCSLLASGLLYITNPLDAQNNDDHITDIDENLLTIAGTHFIGNIGLQRTQFECFDRIQDTSGELDCSYETNHLRVKNGITYSSKVTHYDCRKGDRAAGSGNCS